LIELLVVISILAILATLTFGAAKRMKDMAAGAVCTSNMRALAIATMSFTGDREGRLPPLYISRGDGRTVLSIDTPPKDCVVQNAAALFWTDMLYPYLSSKKVFTCPLLKTVATPGQGGGFSDNQPLGIGLNYPNIGGTYPGGPGTGFEGMNKWTLVTRVEQRSRVVLFTDAGGKDDASIPWEERKDERGRGGTYIRASAEMSGLAIPRHGGAMNVAFLDGHVERLKPSQIDWGKRDNSGQTKYVGWVEIPAN
jgi:prepilin-type processing-associated H-X9-DG protein